MTTYRAWNLKPLDRSALKELTAAIAQQSTEELENRPGIVGYFVKNGDTLWNLAKKYNTTVENIKEVNHMEKEDVNKGDKILIFKQNLSIL